MSPSTPNMIKITRTGKVAQVLDGIHLPAALSHLRTSPGAFPSRFLVATEWAPSRAPWDHRALFVAVPPHRNLGILTPDGALIMFQPTSCEAQEIDEKHARRLENDGETHHGLTDLSPQRGLSSSRTQVVSPKIAATIYSSSSRQQMRRHASMTENKNSKPRSFPLLASGPEADSDRDRVAWIHQRSRPLSKTHDGLRWCFHRLFSGASRAPGCAKAMSHVAAASPRLRAPRRPRRRSPAAEHASVRRTFPCRRPRQHARRRQNLDAIPVSHTPSRVVRRQLKAHAFASTQQHAAAAAAVSLVIGARDLAFLTSLCYIQLHSPHFLLSRVLVARVP